MNGMTAQMTRTLRRSISAGALLDALAEMTPSRATALLVFHDRVRVATYESGVWTFAPDDHEAGAPDAASLREGRLFSEEREVRFHRQGDGFRVDAVVDAAAGATYEVRDRALLLWAGAKRTGAPFVRCAEPRIQPFFVPDPGTGDGGLLHVLVREYLSEDEDGVIGVVASRCVGLEWRAGQEVDG